MLKPVQELQNPSEDAQHCAMHALSKTVRVGRRQWSMCRAGAIMCHKPSIFFPLPTVDTKKIQQEGKSEAH